VPSEIVRWKVGPHLTPRRTALGHLIARVPWLVPLGARLIFRLPAGSRLRRFALDGAFRLAIGALNRQDWDVLFPALAPAFELHLTEDPARLGAGLEPVYKGQDAHRQVMKVWTEPFEDFRWELKELLDPGGNVIGGLAEMAARGSGSGVETRAPQAAVWTLERGLMVRQELFWDQVAAEARLRELSRTASG
jgi:ketosteroid isomerase-like protein